MNEQQLYRRILETMLSEKSKLQKIAYTILQSSKKANTSILLRDTLICDKKFLSKGMINIKFRTVITIVREVMRKE